MGFPALPLSLYENATTKSSQITWSLKYILLAAWGFSFNVTGYLSRKFNLFIFPCSFVFVMTWQSSVIWASCKQVHIPRTVLKCVTICLKLFFFLSANDLSILSLSLSLFYLSIYIILMGRCFSIGFNIAGAELKISNLLPIRNLAPAACVRPCLLWVFQQLAHHNSYYMIHYIYTFNRFTNDELQL